MKVRLLSLLCMLLGSAICLAASSGGSGGQRVTVILYGGVVVPMTLESERYEAIAIAGDSIVALGSDDEILALASPDTTLVDLDGRALYPGLTDPHTHLLDWAETEGLTLDQAQDLAIENGFTTIANMHTDPSTIGTYIDYASAGHMRVRCQLYLVHTNGCGETVGTWYEQYAPDKEIAPWLYMGGVKLFIERSVCGDQPVVIAFSPAARRTLTAKGAAKWGDAQLIYSEDELADIIRGIDAKGYQVAIHAIGDLGVQTCLDAYEDVLDGRANVLRHMILHNQFLRDDMLPSYAELGILALVEMSSPQAIENYARAVGEENITLFRRWGDLLDAGAYAALDSDWPFFPISLGAKLAAFVGGQNADPGLASLGPCTNRTSQTVTAWEAMQMMTAHAAYALRVETTRGTLETGKAADLVVLSQDPLSISPAEIGETRVVLTMIGGRVEYDPGGLVAPHNGV